jgi:hypothetical protein
MIKLRRFFKSYLKIIQSVLASFFGVQGNNKYNEDNDYLEKNGFTPFLIVGIFIVIIFLSSLFFIVGMILK